VEHTREYQQAGVPDALAARIAALPFLTPALDIVSLAAEHGISVESAARRYFELGDRYSLDELRARAQSLVMDDGWEREAVAALQDDLAGHQRQLTSSVLESAAVDDSGDTLGRWTESRHHAEQRLRERLEQLRSDTSLSLAKLVVANCEIRGLIEAGA
jgi:glutamate dehydrogenase